jgi:hypothetical protein|tara:strand:- start:578 stop:1438 length:861 start_codon:yes stop_codon:yes gene_type:complete
MTDNRTTAEELIQRIVEDQVDYKYPGIGPGELTGPPYYDKKAEDPEAPLDKIVHDARSFRTKLEMGLTKHAMPQLKEEADKVRRRVSRGSFSAYEKRSEEQQFFNRPEAGADFSHWVCMAYWSAEEAVALILGKDPKRVNLINLDEYTTRVSPFIQRFKNLKELTDRAIEVGLMPGQITPESLVRWAAQTGIEVPDELQELATYTITENKDGLSETERTSLLKMILGMAVSKYGYHGDASRNTATGDNRGSIASDLEKIGIALDSDTIRAHLKEAWNKFGDIQKPK